MLRVIDFLFCRMGALESFQKIAQMSGLGDNIERNMSPSAWLPLPLGIFTQALGQWPQSKKQGTRVVKTCEVIPG